jgi:hypothetical protein
MRRSSAESLVFSYCLKWTSASPRSVGIVGIVERLSLIRLAHEIQTMAGARSFVTGIAKKTKKLKNKKNLFITNRRNQPTWTFTASFLLCIYYNDDNNNNIFFWDLLLSRSITVFFFFCFSLFYYQSRFYFFGYQRTFIFVRYLFRYSLHIL